MSPLAEYTRQSIAKPVVHLFAEQGFEATSARDIVARARATQAAINYPLQEQGRLVPRNPQESEKLAERAGFDPEKLRSLSHGNALRRAHTIGEIWAGMLAS